MPRYGARRRAACQHARLGRASTDSTAPDLAPAPARHRRRGLGGRRARRACPAPRRATRRATAGARADVAIVGAGFAGLTAARELERKGHSVDRARGARPGRRPGPQRGDRRRRDHRARRAPSPARPRTTCSRSPTKMRVGLFDDLQHRREPLHRQRLAAALHRHRPDRHGAAGPGDPARPRAGRHRPRTRSRRRCPVDAPWAAANAAEWDAQTLEQYIEANATTPAVQGAGPDRDPADLRRRAARALAALRPLLHRRLGQRGQPRHLRAQLQHPRRRADVPLRRRLAADLRAAGAQARPRGWCSTRRCGGSSRTATA